MFVQSELHRIISYSKPSRIFKRFATNQCNSHRLLIKAVSMKKSQSGSGIVFELFGLQFFTLSSEEFQDRINAASSISKKHRFYLVIVILMLSSQVSGIIYAIRLEALVQQNDNVMKGLTVQFSAYFSMIVVILVTVLNAFTSTSKAKKIFASFENVFGVFAHSLNELVDYEAYNQKFKATFFKVVFIFIVSTAAVLAFIFHFNQSNKPIFLWAVLSVYPYFFFAILFSYFLFMVELVKQNLQSMRDVLDKLHELHDCKKLCLQIVDAHFKLRHDKMFKSLTKLKTIYSILVSDCVSLTNEFIGLPLLVAIIVLVMGNISGGYKVYLRMMDEIDVARVGG